MHRDSTTESFCSIPIGRKVRAIGGRWNGMVGWLKGYHGTFAALHSEEWRHFPERAVNLEYSSLEEVPHV